MYCVKCGVELADTEKKCPLCATVVYHPDVAQATATPLYPRTSEAPKKVKRWVVMLILTILFLLPISVCLTADLLVNGKMEWAGYVIGALMIFYSAVMLPSWFHKPNPVIFTPIPFAVVAVYLLNICYATDGNWYFTLALPATAAVALIVNAMVVLCRYILKGRLYIYGGALIAVGLFAVLLEFLLTLTFPTMPPLFTWSLYPLSTFTLFGAAMLTAACYRPLRESLEKKLFL